MTKTIKKCCISLVALMLFCGIFSSILPVYAGLTNSMIAQNETTSYWKSIKGYNVSYTESENETYLDFKDSSEGKESFVVCRYQANDMSEYGTEKCLYGSFALRINDLPDDHSFSFFTGLQQKSSSLFETKSTLEFYFTKSESNLLFGTRYYDDEGKPVQVLASQKLAGIDFNKKHIFDFDLTNTNKLKIMIGNQIIFQDTINYNGGKLGVGFLGFKQSGASGADRVNVRISDVKLYAYQYMNSSTVYSGDNNKVLSEDFNAVDEDNSGYYNSNLIYTFANSSAKMGGSKLSITDGKLVMYNTGFSYISTKSEYSNFELSFDIVDMQRVAQINSASGSIEKPVLGYMGLVMGGGNYEISEYNAIRSTFFFFNSVSRGASGSYVFYENDQKAFANSSESYVGKGGDIYREDYQGKILGIKFRLVDGMFSYSYRIDGAEWQEAYRYNTGFTPIGHLALAFEDTANIAIDNFKVENLDENPLLTQVGLKTNIIKKDPVFDYQDKWEEDDLLTNRIKSDLAPLWVVLSIVILDVVLLAAGTVVLIVMKKRKKYEEKK